MAMRWLCALAIAAQALGDLANTCSEAAATKPATCLLQAMTEADKHPQPSRVQMETYDDPQLLESDDVQPPGGGGNRKGGKPKPGPRKPAPTTAVPDLMTTTMMVTDMPSDLADDALAGNGNANQIPPMVDGDVLAIAPFGKEDTARELTDLAARTQDTLVDAVENAEVAEIKRSVFRSLTRLRAAQIKEFDTIARLETQAIDEYNDNHHYRKENPLQYLHSDEPTVNEDKYTSFHD